MTSSAPLRALVLNCSLKPSSSDEPSSTQLLADQVLEQLAQHGVESAGSVRVVDHDVRPGVEADMGDGDEWPQIRERMLDAEVLVLATPTWVGKHSSVAQRVLERLDAELSHRDDEGRPYTFGRVVVVATVGNEDGAHHIAAEVFQAVNDMGFSVPAQGHTYWNGEAMHPVDYTDLDSTPDAVASTTATAARNAAHLARVLREQPYPPVS